MTPDRQHALDLMTPGQSASAPLQERLDGVIHELLASFPNPAHLSAADRRGIIARYSAVLEGNFIYWMTATYLAVESDEAHAIIEDNLREEVRDNHPGMLRKFAMAADAMPTDSDALAVNRDLQGVRQFVARLSGVRLVVMMAFFEGWITKFMPYLAELAARQGSTEQEYTDVHGVVDIVHTQGLFQALDAEFALLPEPVPPMAQLLEGAEALGALISTIVHFRAGATGRTTSEGR